MCLPPPCLRWGQRRRETESRQANGCPGWQSRGAQHRGHGAGMARAVAHVPAPRAPSLTPAPGCPLRSRFTNPSWDEGRGCLHSTPTGCTESGAEDRVPSTPRTVGLRFKPRCRHSGASAPSGSHRRGRERPSALPPKGLPSRIPKMGTAWSPATVGQNQKSVTDGSSGNTPTWA